MILLVRVEPHGIGNRLNSQSSLAMRPSWPILICPHTPTRRLHTQAGKHAHTLRRTRAKPGEPSPNPLRCPVLAAYGVLRPLASLGLALPHLEGGCWPDASLRRGSDRSWTALSQQCPQSFLPVAWPTSVLPKRSEWIWQIYYLSHLYQLSRGALPSPRAACEATSGALFFVVSSWWSQPWIHDPASTSRLLSSPVSSRPVPSTPAQPSSHWSVHLTSLESVTAVSIHSHTSLAPS